MNEEDIVDEFNGPVLLVNDVLKNKILNMPNFFFVIKRGVYNTYIYI